MDPNENVGTKINENEETRISQDELASSSKRTILKAAWVPPVITVLSLPPSGFGANISNNQGNNNNNQ